MSRDVVMAGSRWIPENEYAFIRSRVPIVCVDILLRRQDNPLEIGLIHRETYAGRLGWCLVGGSVLRDEPLFAALKRHVLATLGDNIQIDRKTVELATVAEYFTVSRPGELHDPRKHAVSLTYTALCSGDPEPAGEARDFAWFQVDQLISVPFGFGQDRVVSEVLKMIAPDDE